MDFSWIYKIILLIICFFFSAFFSGSEVALFSFDKKRLREFKKEHRVVGVYIHSLLENPRRFLVTILLGNTVVNVGASIIAAVLTLQAAKNLNISDEIALLIQIIILTIVLLFFGEMTPKLWASKYPEQFLKIAAIPLYWIGVLVYPISKVLTDILKAATSKIEFDNSRTALRGAEIKELANLGVEQGTIEEEEHDLIHGIVAFKTVTAREVMTPRVDIVAVSLDTTFDELISIINDCGHSRLPLYENSLDKILGIIYSKDLLPFLKSPELRKTISLKSICREALFIPETKMINHLLHEFQEKNMHIGIVVDEYGGTAGLISLEDILEEIVGEIHDEYDQEETEITKINENSYMVLGKVSVDELNELLDHDFSSESDDYDTVGGFIFNQAGIIPKQGFHFTLSNYKFTVKEVSNNRVNKVLIERIDNPE